MAPLEPLTWIQLHLKNQVEALKAVAEEANVRIFLALVWKIKEPGEEGAYDENNKQGRRTTSAARIHLTIMTIVQES